MLHPTRPDEFQDKAKQIPVGENRKRGKPKKTAPALVYQPGESVRPQIARMTTSRTPLSSIENQVNIPQTQSASNEQESSAGAASASIEQESSMTMTQKKKRGRKSKAELAEIEAQRQATTQSATQIDAPETQAPKTSRRKNT